ncbi:glutamate--cysteine ligase [bacterium]|nr:glutamate--cysteine ligase [bacterium]
MLTRNDLYEYFQGNCNSRRKIGIEIEHLPVYTKNMSFVPYSHMKKILHGICEKYHMDGVFEDNNLFGAQSSFGHITIEPGAQLEFSSMPFDSIQDCYQVIKGFANNVLSIVEKENIALLHIGMHPNTDMNDIPFIPKKRYEIMSNCMTGDLAHYMMKGTASIQCSLDYDSPETFVNMMKVIFSTAPIATAMFLNSPFYMGALTSFQGFRSKIWTETDDPRCGFIPQIFNKNFGFEEFIEFIIDAPMLFVKDSNGHYDFPPDNLAFGKYMEYNPEITITEFQTHLNSIFTFARADKYIEIRCADSLPEDLLFSIPAFWKGLLYDNDTLDSALELCHDWEFTDLIKAAHDVPALGLQAVIGKYPVIDIAKQLISLSRNGLEAIDKKFKTNDTRYIEPLEEMIVEFGVNHAQKLIRIFEKSGSIDSILESVKCRH